MEELIGVVNTQTDSYMEKFTSGKDVFKVRTYYLNSNSVWRNSDLHLLCSERSFIKLEDKRYFDPMEKYLYVIIRLDRLIEENKVIFDNAERFEGFLMQIDRKRNIESSLNVADNFDYGIVFGTALVRLNRLYKRKSFQGREGYYFDDIQSMLPVEEISVDLHQKLYDSLKLSMTEVARYLEIPVDRARALSHCPGFPIQKSGCPRRVLVNALNSWLRMNPELVIFPTDSLVKYMKRKKASRRMIPSSYISSIFYEAYSKAIESLL